MRPATSHLVSLSFDLISDVVEVGEFLVTNLHKEDFGDPSCNIPNNFSSSAIAGFDAFDVLISRLVKHGPRFIFSVLLQLQRAGDFRCSGELSNINVL